MYTEGMADLNEMILVLPLCPPDQKEAKIAQIKEKVTDTQENRKKPYHLPEDLKLMEIRGDLNMHF